MTRFDVARPGRLWGALWMVVGALAGCGPAPGGDEGPPDAGALADAGSGPAWQVSYSGALSGAISGNVTAVVRQNLSLYSVSIAGDTVGEELMSGSYQFPRGTTTGQTLFLSFNINLADGTDCGTVGPSTALVNVDVITDDGTSHRAEFAGDLLCTGDQRITIDGYFTD